MSKCKSTPREVTVYALSSSCDGEVRYIGQTTQPLNSRLRAHVSRARRVQDRYLGNWINRQLTDGSTIQIAVLVANAIWDVDECRLIAEYRTNGSRLVNATTGGQGTYGDEHHRGRKGVKKPDGFGAKLSAAKTGVPGKPWTEERRRLQSEMRKNVPLKDGHAEKIANALRGKPKSEAHRQALSELKAGKRPNLTADQETKRAINAALSSSRADVREKRSVSMKRTLAMKKAAKLQEADHV